jgi:hypothetical protein
LSERLKFSALSYLSLLHQKARTERMAIMAKERAARVFADLTSPRVEVKPISISGMIVPFPRAPSYLS